jgi:predicted DNA-binding transcriptional regulator AlpA
MGATLRKARLKNEVANPNRLIGCPRNIGFRGPGFDSNRQVARVRLLQGNKLWRIPMEAIHPNQIIRVKDGPLYFGLSDSQIEFRIKAGDIPAPMALSTTGRAKGWLGSQILEYQARLMARHNQTAA